MANDKAPKPPKAGEATGEQKPKGYKTFDSVHKLGTGSLGALLDRGRPSPGTFRTYRQMRGNPTVAMARLIATAPIRTAEWAIEGDDEVPEERKLFIQQQMQRLWPLLINDMMLALDYGFSPFEIVWAPSEEGDGTKLVIQRVKPLLVDITNPNITKDTGAFDGLRNGEDELPKQKCLWYVYDQEAGNLYGRSRHENIRETAWKDWTDVASKCSRYIKRVSGAVPMIEYPDGESTDKSGATRSHWDIARQLLNELEKCNGIAMPNVLAPYAEDFARSGGNAEKLRAWNIGFLESKDSHGSEFLEIMRHKESLMMRGWLVPERAATEAQTAGSRADSESHSDLMSGMADLVLQDCVLCVNDQLINPLLEYNFGVEARDSLRMVRSKVDTEVQAFIRELTKVVLGAPANVDMLLELIDLNQLLDTAGLPKTSEQINQKALVAKREQAAKEMQEQLQAKGPGGEGGPPKPGKKKDEEKDLATSMVDDVLEVYKRARAELRQKKTDGQLALSFDEDQPRDATGKWTSGAGAGPGAGARQPGSSVINALPLPPKNATFQGKAFYQDRQRAYTRMRAPNLTDYQRKQRTADFEAATKRLETAKTQHPEWFGGQASLKGQKPPPVAPTPPKTPPPDTKAKEPKETRPQAPKTPEKANPVGPDRKEPLAKGFKKIASDALNTEWQADVEKHAKTVAESIHQNFGTKVEFSREHPTRNQVHAAAIAGSEFARMNESMPGVARELKKNPLPRIRYQATDLISKDESPGLSGRTAGAIGCYHMPKGEPVAIHIATADLEKEEDAKPNRFTVGKSAAVVMRHELGHHLYYHCSDETNLRWQEAFLELSNQQKYKISAYAGSSTTECFAESFALYTSPKYKRGMLPPSIEAHMDKRFGGR